MNTTPWIDRIKAQCPSLRFVGGALDLDETTLKAAAFPAAFVVPLSESGEPDGMLGRHTQRLTQSWAVVIALRSVRTASRDDTDALDLLRTEVKAALCGWAPNTSTGEPVQFVAGQLLDASGSALLWQDDYSVQAHIYNP